MAVRRRQDGRTVKQCLRFIAALNDRENGMPALRFELRLSDS